MKLFLKVALFTAVMPGTFAGLLPFLIVGDRTVGGGVTPGLACGLFAFGLILYLRSAWDFALRGTAPRTGVRGGIRCVRGAGRAVGAASGGGCRVGRTGAD